MKYRYFDDNQKDYGSHSSQPIKKDLDEYEYRYEKGGFP